MTVAIASSNEDVYAIPSFGDSSFKSNSNFRYIFQNINGKFNNQLQQNNTITKLLKQKPDAIGLAKTNVIWNQKICTQYKQVLSQHWPHHQSSLAHCKNTNIHPSKCHLQGGLFQSIHGKHSDRIKFLMKMKLEGGLHRPHN